MVQLSSKVMCARVPDASCICFGNVRHTFLRLAKKDVAVHKSCCSFIVRFCTCTDAFWMLPDVSRVRPRRFLHGFQTRLICVSDTCEHYLGAVLYCTLLFTDCNFLYNCVEVILLQNHNICKL